MKSKTLSVLAVLTFVLMLFASANIFGGFSIGKSVAAVLSGFDALIGDSQQGPVTASGIQAQHFSEEEMQILLEQTHGKVADVTVEEIEANKEDEEPISTEDWRIFYTESSFGGAQAYTLRYPKSWVLNDTLARKKVFTYNVDGTIYSLALYEESINIASTGKSATSTTTTFGDAEYVKKTDESTFVSYTPKSHPHSFNIAFGTLPKGQAEEYIKIYDAVLSTLAVELAEYPFTISNLNVELTGPLLTTDTAIAEPLHVSWQMQGYEKVSEGQATLELWIEDSVGKRIIDITNPRQYSAQSATLLVPQSANSDFVFGERYRAVAQGSANGKSTNKVYSSWFTLLDSQQFSGPRLTATPTTQGKISVEASILGRADASHAYMAFLDDGAYTILSEAEAGKFTGEWRRSYSKGAHTVHLMRTTVDALNQNLHGAQTYEEVQQYATTVKSATFSIE